MSVSLALADDFKTQDGKEYKGATVTRVEPDGVVVKTKTGISKLYFAELPQEVQQRFHYNPQQARAYSVQQSAAYSAIQKDQEQAEHQPQGTALEDQPGLNEQQPATNTGPAGQRQRPTPFPRYPRRYTTVLQQLPQTQQPKPTPAPPPPKPKPPAPHASQATHPKGEGQKKHK